MHVYWYLVRGLEQLCFWLIFLEEHYQTLLLNTSSLTCSGSESSDCRDETNNLKVYLLFLSLVLNILLLDKSDTESQPFAIVPLNCKRVTPEALSILESDVCWLVRFPATNNVYWPSHQGKISGWFWANTLLVLAQLVNFSPARSGFSQRFLAGKNVNYLVVSNISIFYLDTRKIFRLLLSFWLLGFSLTRRVLTWLWFPWWVSAVDCRILQLISVKTLFSLNLILLPN